MACRISELVLDCLDPRAQALWWAEVLGWVVVDEEDGVYEIAPPGVDDPELTMVFLPVADPSPAKLRLHVDLSPTDTDQATELKRLLALGARPADIGQPADASWHVLQDPERNELCLLRTPKPR
jgi:hypothetical protein